MIVNKNFICILLIIVLFALFYFTKFNYIEPFALDDQLKNYLALNGLEKGFVKGYPLDFKVPSCLVSDPNGSGSQIGNLWKVEYKDGTRDVCVPDIYRNKNAYIPCNSPNPGPPDLTGCGIPDPDSECVKEMEKVPNSINYEDRQQYVYSCKNGKCPCTWKYGKDYKIKCVDSVSIGCKGTLYGCCQDEITVKNKLGTNCIDSYNVYNGLSWIGCTKYKNRVTDYKNKQKFNSLCNRANRGSFLVKTDGRGCVQPQNTNIGCSLVPQKILKTN